MVKASPVTASCPVVDAVVSPPIVPKRQPKPKPSPKPTPKITVKKAAIVRNSFLFPYDLSSWLCAEYLQETKNNGTWWRIAQLLKVRPHQFHPQVALPQLRSLPSAYAPKQRKTFYYHKVHKAVYDDLIALLNAAQQAGFNLRVQSAFRSVDRQNLLWQGRVRKHQFAYEKAAHRVAPPCFSEHATGMAVDFSLRSIHQKVGAHPVYAWLQAHAADYGWMQSFVAGEPGVSAKVSKPGVLPEAWHFHHRLLEQNALE